MLKKVFHDLINLLTFFIKQLILLRGDIKRRDYSSDQVSDGTLIELTQPPSAGSINGYVWGYPSKVQLEDGTRLDELVSQKDTMADLIFIMQDMYVSPQGEYLLSGPTKSLSVKTGEQGPLSPVNVQVYLDKLPKRLEKISIGFIGSTE